MAFDIQQQLALGGLDAAGFVGASGALQGLPAKGLVLPQGDLGFANVNQRAFVAASTARMGAAPLGAATAQPWMAANGMAALPQQHGMRANAGVPNQAALQQALLQQQRMQQQQEVLRNLAAAQQQQAQAAKLAQQQQLAASMAQQQQRGFYLREDGTMAQVPLGGAANGFAPAAVRNNGVFMPQAGVGNVMQSQLNGANFGAGVVPARAATQGRNNLAGVNGMGVNGMASLAQQQAVQQQAVQQQLLAQQRVAAQAQALAVQQQQQAQQQALALQQLQLQQQIQAQQALQRRMQLQQQAQAAQNHATFAPNALSPNTINANVINANGAVGLKPLGGSFPPASSLAPATTTTQMLAPVATNPQLLGARTANQTLALPAPNTAMINAAALRPANTNASAAGAPLDSSRVVFNATAKRVGVIGDARRSREDGSAAGSGANTPASPANSTDGNTPLSASPLPSNANGAANGGNDPAVNAVATSAQDKVLLLRMFGARLAETGMSIEAAMAAGLIGQLAPEDFAILAAAHRAEGADPALVVAKAPGRLAASDDGVLGGDMGDAQDSSDKASVVSADARILVGEGSGEAPGSNGGSRANLLALLDAGNEPNSAVKAPADEPAANGTGFGVFGGYGGAFNGGFNAFNSGFNGFLGAMDAAPAGDQRTNVVGVNAGAKVGVADAAARLANLTLGF